MESSRQYEDSEISGDLVGHIVLNLFLRPNIYLNTEKTDREGKLEAVDQTRGVLLCQVAHLQDV